MILEGSIMHSGES